MHTLSSIPLIGSIRAGSTFVYPTLLHLLYLPFSMCYQVVERYAVCRCLYHKHAIDPCAQYGQYGHSVQEKTVLVGYACNVHTNYSLAAPSSSSGYDSQLPPDSGYSSYSSLDSCSSLHRYRRF
ncbi:hypothetical protein SLS55_000453 [Diplodia seriata]|uniref:Uncharacterized protein n=2 Tax=Diplodia seriata TaxID=420778 RepID=A0ABR3CUB3_9PEZI